MKFCKLLILLLLPALAKAQNPDSLKVESLRNKGYDIEQTNEKGARAYYGEGLELSRTIANPFLEAGCLLDLGDLEEINGHYENAEAIFRQALQIGERIHSPLRMGSAYLNIGNSLLYRNQQVAAIDNYLLSEAQLLKIRDNKRLSPLYANIEAVFFDLENYPKALEYGEKAIATAIQVGNPGITASAYVNTSNTLNKLGRKQQSIEYLQHSLAFARQAPEPDHKQDAYQNLADRYLDEGEYHKAKLYADSSLYYARAINSSDVLSNALNISGVIYQKLNQLDSAQSYLLQSNQYGQQNGNWKLLRENYAALAELAKQQGKFEQAYLYESQYAALKDSTFKESVNKQVGELEAKFETAQKQTQIVSLEKSRQKQTFLIIALSGGVIALTTIGILFYRNSKRQVRQLQQEKQLVVMDAILKGQEDERSRMARDLHDGLGYMLSGVKLSLNHMNGNYIIDNEGTLGMARTLNLLDSSITELRRIARNLMPEALLRFGLPDAMADFIHPINEIPNGPRIELQVFGFSERLESGTEIILFRILQELLNNIMKHAGASQAYVQLIRDGQRLSITVEDNGKGFDTEQALQGSGMGNIRSRVEYLNGRLDFQSRPGEGTFVQIEIENLPS